MNLYIITSIRFFFLKYTNIHIFTSKNIPKLCQRHKHPHLSVSLKSMCDKPVSINCTRRENFHGREQLLSLTIIGWLQQYPWLAWLFQFCHFLWICKIARSFQSFFRFSPYYNTVHSWVLRSQYPF